MARYVSHSNLYIVVLNHLFCVAGWHSLVVVAMRFVSDLYGVNVRPVAPVGSASRRPYVDPALIHRSLPDELLFEVFHIIKLYILIIDLMAIFFMVEVYCVGVTMGLVTMC